MSGIYGLVRYDGLPVTDEALAPMAAAMSRWGHDGHGQWRSDSAALGHFLLRVTPESLHERLPASIQTAPHLIITADARIDNRDELFNALGVPLPGRDRTPDSSLILLAYERWGQDCLQRLLGDFSFAIWDARTRSLFCARDPFGCRPFVYCDDGKRFIFASDVRGVLSRIESPRLNEPLLAAYLQMRTYHAEKTFTFFEKIVKLLPGHSLNVTASGTRISRYWSPEDSAEIREATPADYAERLRELVRQAVDCRLRSAFPVGAHISGGLDSSTIAIMASRALRDQGRELTAFSWSPPPAAGVIGLPVSEYARIDAVCRQESIICRYISTTKESFFESFRRDLAVEPTALMVHEANVQDQARAAGLRVMLSGWGGDDAASVNAANSFPNMWPELLNAARIRLAGRDRQSFLSKARGLGGIARSLVVSRLPDSLYSLTARNALLKYRPSCVQAAFAHRYEKQLRELRGPAWRTIPDIREQICYRLDFGYIQLRLEHWAGSGAVKGLDYRYPMLDRRIIELVLGIPRSQLTGSYQNRDLFRRAIAGVLPESADWFSAKNESVALPAFKRENADAHSEWARRVISEGRSSPATRFVDPDRILAAVGSHSSSGTLAELAGVRAALRCYTMKVLT